MSMDKDFQFLQEENQKCVREYIITLKKNLELNRIMHNWDDVEALEYTIKELERSIEL